MVKSGLQHGRGNQVNMVHLVFSHYFQYRLAGNRMLPYQVYAIFRDSELECLRSVDKESIDYMLDRRTVKSHEERCPTHKEKYPNDKIYRLYYDIKFSLGQYFSVNTAI
eukprot:g25203.t1